MDGARHAVEECEPVCVLCGESTEGRLEIRHEAGALPHVAPSQLFIHACSFCGHNDSPLVIGPRVSICHNCIDSAVDARSEMLGVHRGDQESVKSLLLAAVRGLVDRPDMVAIGDQLIGDDVIELTIYAAPADVGKIVGRGGKGIGAIRELVKGWSGASSGPRRVLERVEEAGADRQPVGPRHNGLERKAPPGSDPDVIVSEYLRAAALQVDEMTPSQARTLVAFAGGEAEEVRAYLLGMYADQLRRDTARVLRG